MAIAFTVTTLTGSPSLALAAAVPAISGTPAHEGWVQDLYTMPAELGSLVSLWQPAEEKTSSPFVVHIQDAHANPEGQQHIAAMLRYLESKAPGLSIGLEGASGSLHPEYLEFFKDYPEANQAVVESLNKQGELNGVERFLLEKRWEGGWRRAEGVKAEAPSSILHPPSVLGIETPELYRDNLKTYRELLSRRGDMQKLLAPARVALEKEASKTLRAELRDFLKERSRRKEGKFDLEASLGAQSDADLATYIRYLRSLVLKQLEIDLNDPIEQLRFPHLMRIVQLETIRSGYAPAAVRAQWEAAIRDLKAAAKTADEKAFISELIAFANEKKFIEIADALPVMPAVGRDLYPRAMVEKLFRFAQAHQLSFSGREAFWQSWKLAVFQAEVDIAELIEEIERLEGLLLEQLAVSDAEKTLVQKLGDLDLLEKMLRLELSRREYSRAWAGRDRLQVFVAGSKPLAAALQKAYGFYNVSLERDEALVENLLKIQDGGWGMEDGEKKLAPSALRPPPSKIFVLYSGGFHTPGIEAILRQKGIGYAVFSPRISKTDHGEMYQRAMDGDNADLSAYFKVRNPFLTKQEALLFKQLIETAAPALSKAYKLSPDQVAARVSQAVKDHPVLSGVVVAEWGSETEPASVRFQSKPDLQMLIPQNSSAIPESNLEAVQIARANVTSLSAHEPVAGVVDFASGAVSSATTPRSEARIPQVEFFHPSRKTSRLAYSFMRQALREKAVDPMTGKTVDLEAIANDVNDLNRALLSLSGDQLKGLCRNIIADTKPLMIPGEENDHDLAGLKWLLTQKAHELLVGHYGIHRSGGFGNATDPILMISEIIAEMYLKKRIGHELPTKYAAFQRPTSVETPMASPDLLPKDKPSLGELAARIRAAAAKPRSEMREIPGLLTRQQGFSGELVVPEIKVAPEYFFEFDSRKGGDAQARFIRILQALKTSLRAHLQEELLPVSEALIDIFDPENYSGSKAQKKAFAAKMAQLKASLQETLDPASYKQIEYLIDAQLKLQGEQNGDRNPVGPLVKFYESVIRAMLPSGAPEDAQRKDLYTEADITLRQFQVLIYSQFRCATDPDKQLDMLEAALDKQIAQAESMAQSDDMSIMTQGMMLRSRLKAVKRRFLGVNREGIKKLLTPSSSIITILYSKMLASDMVSPEEFQRLDKLTLEKTGKPLGGKAKEHFMYGRGLYQRQRFIEEQIRREGIEMCKRKYPHYYTIPDLVDSLENVIAEVAEQGTVEYDPGKSRRVVVKIDQTIGVGQFKEIVKMYPGMVGVFTDSITANSHVSAISPVPILIVDPSDQNFHEIKKGDTVAVEPTPDGQTIAKVDADQEESARIEAENEKRVLLEKAFRTLVPLDSRNKHLANTVVGEDLDAFWDILEGLGLNRTEVDEKVEKEMVEMIRSYNKMPEGERSYQKLSRKLLDIMVQGYYAQVHNPKLKGRTNKFRTIDVQRDKNENLFVYYKGGAGIEFYETDLGREVLTTQVAALLMILGNEALEQKSLASRIQIMFPQVRNRKDAIFFRDMILPEAIKRAQLELKRSRGRLRSLGDADGTLNGKIHPPLNDEVVAAAVEQALDAVSFESMAETMSLFEPSADGETGNLELDEILKLEYRGKPFIQGISVGMNDTEFSIVRDLVEKRSANQPITGLTQGESDILDEIVKKLQGRNLADLTRDEAVLQPFFGKLTPIFVRYYEAIAQAAAAKAGIPLSFCGETAGKDEFELFAQYLTRTHKISLSKSMGPRKIGRLRFQSHRIERDLDQRTEMPEWFQKFSRGEDASEAMNRYLSNAFVEDPALQSFLLDLAKVQEEFVAEGYFDGLFRPDFNPLNQAGGYGIFSILKSQFLRQKPDVQLSDGAEVNPRDLLAILDYMKERVLISDGQAQTVTEAYWLFQVIAEVFENLKRQGSSLVYEDGLNPETIGTFYQKVAEVYAQRIRQPLPWGAGAPEETVAAYSSMLFGLVTDTLRDEYMERIPPMQQTQVIQDLEQAGGVGTTGQEELLEMVMDERSDITLYLETLTGFRYSREKYMRIRPKAHPDQDFVERIVYHFRYVPEDMIRILLVAAEKGARIDLRVQRAMSIIAHEKSRNPDPSWTQRLNEKGWPLLHQMLQLHQNVHYSEIQLTRFNLLQFLLPKEDMPSSSRILSVRRSMTLLEILSKEDPFQVRAYHVLRSLGTEPRHLLTLRLALYPNLLKSISKVDPDGNAERFRVMQLLNAVNALLRQDLLSPVEIEKAVEGILSAAEAGQMSSEERLVFFQQVYLMTLVQRMAAFDPVDRKLLLQEGIYSPFAAIEQVYLALVESLALPDSFSIPAAVRRAGEMVANAKAWQTGAQGYQEIAIYPRGLFDDFRQGIATGGVWRSVLEDYLGHTQEGELSGLRNYLEEVIKDNTRLSEYFGHFTKENSEYYFRGLGPKELLRQLFHYIHLDYLRNMDLDNGNVEVVATVRPAFFRKITSSVHHTYEIGFGDVIDHPGILGLYLKVLGRNGFQISGVKPSMVEFPEAKLAAGEKKKTVAQKQSRGFVIRVLGYFPHSVNPEDRIQTIQQDLTRLIKLPRKTSGSIAAQTKAATENAWRLALDTGKGYGATVSAKIPGRQTGSEPDSVSFVRNAGQGLQLLIETRQERTNFYEALIGMIHLKFPGVSVAAIHRNLRGTVNRVVISFEGEIISSDQRKLLELITDYLKSDKASIGRDIYFTSRSESRIGARVQKLLKTGSVAGMLGTVSEDVLLAFKGVVRSESRMLQDLAANWKKIETGKEQVLKGESLNLHLNLEEKAGFTVKSGNSQWDFWIRFTKDTITEEDMFWVDRWSFSSGERTPHMAREAHFLGEQNFMLQSRPGDPVYAAVSIGKDDTGFFARILDLREPLGTTVLWNDRVWDIASPAAEEEFDPYDREIGDSSGLAQVKGDPQFNLKPRDLTTTGTGRESSGLPQILGSPDFNKQPKEESSVAGSTVGSSGLPQILGSPDFSEKPSEESPTTGSSAESSADSRPFIVAAEKIVVNPQYDQTRYPAMKTVGPVLIKAIEQVLAEWPDREEVDHLLELFAESEGSGIFGEPILVDLFVTFFNKGDVRDFLKGYFRFMLRISKASPADRAELLASDQAARYTFFSMPAFLKARPYSNIAFLRQADPRFMVWQGTPEADSTHAMVLENVYHFMQDEDEYIAVFMKWEGREFLFYRPSYRPLWQVADLVAVRGSRYEPLQAVPVPFSVLFPGLAMRLSNLVAQRIAAPSPEQSEAFRKDSDAKGFSDFSFTRELENIWNVRNEDELLEIAGNLGTVRPMLVRLWGIHVLRESSNPRIQQAIDQKLLDLRRARVNRSESRDMEPTESMPLERKFKVHGTYGINRHAAERLVDAVAHYRAQGVIASASLSYGMTTIALDDAVKLAGMDVLPGVVVIRVEPAFSGPDGEEGLRKFWQGIEQVQFNNGNSAEWHHLLTSIEKPLVPAARETVAESREFDVTGIWGVHIRPSQQMKKVAEVFKPVLAAVTVRNMTNLPERRYSMFSDAEMRIAEMYPGNRVRIEAAFYKNIPHLDREKARFWEAVEAIPEPEGDTPENSKVFTSARSESRAFWAALFEKLPFRKKSKLKSDVQESVASVVASLPDRNELVPILERGSLGLEPSAADLPAGLIVRAPSGNFAQTRTAADRDRMVHLLNHVLNSKLVVLCDASSEKSNKIESLRNAVRETLAFFRIYTPEVFRARGGIFFIPRGNEDVFAYRIPSQRSSTKIYVAPVFGSMPVEHALDAWEWDRLTREPWFREMRDLFLEDAAVLEALKKELFAPNPSPELRVRIERAGYSILKHLRTVSGETQAFLPSEFLNSGERTAAVLFQASHPVHKILVVDDDPSLLKLLVAQLRSLERASGGRYTVEWAVDGADALEKLRSGPFDLVVTDLTMPRMGGEELARKILEDGRGEFVLFVSGWGGAGIDLQALREKGLRVDFLQKPYSLQALKDAVESFSPRSEIRNERATGREAAHWLDPVAGFQGDTREFAGTVSKAMGRSEMRKIVEKWAEALEKKGTPGAAAVVAAARQLGLYSQKSLTFEMKDPRKARLWIALKVLEEMEASEGRVENRDLRDVITKVLASAGDLRTVADMGEAGPEFHVNMSRMNEAGVFENPTEKDWNELARNFPVVIALLISLHGSLSINVNVPEAELAAIRQKFAAVIEKEGILMKNPKLFRFVSAPAKSPFESFKSGKASWFARDLEAVKTYDRNVTRWFSNDKGNMASFAAGLATALLRSAGDENLDRRKVHEPSEFDRVLAAVVNAIAGYASIRKSA